MKVAVSEMHNAAEPNMMAGGIVYQNWALIPQLGCTSKEHARFNLIPQPCRKHSWSSLLPVILLNYLH